MTSDTHAAGSVDQGEWLQTRPGERCLIPRHIPHSWGNATGSTLRMISMCGPGGVEAIQPLMARGGDIDVKALGAKFGVRVVGPPLLGG